MSVIRMLPSRVRVLVARVDQERQNLRRAIYGERSRGCRFDDAPDESRVVRSDAPEFREPTSLDASVLSESTHAGAHVETDSVAMIEFSRSGIEVRVEDLEQTLLKAGLDAGVDLFYSCTLGGCAACILDVVEGRVEYEDPSSLCLTDDEIETGEVCLACVARPRGRIVIDA